MSVEDRLPLLKKLKGKELNGKLKAAVERVSNKDIVDLFTSFDPEDIESIVLLGGTPVYDPVYTNIYLREKNLINTKSTENCIIIDGSENFRFNTFPTESNKPNISPLLNSSYTPKIAFISPLSTGRSVKNNSVEFEFENFLDQEDYNYVVLAGGAAVGNFMGKDFYDYDFFFHNCDENKANDIILKFYNNALQQKKLLSADINGNVVNFRLKNIIGKKESVQFILRLYSSISQVIHGFDVDSSCVAYDFTTEEYILTERAKYAIEKRFNTLNFEKLSPSYEYRIVKSLKRGFSFSIPFGELLSDGYSFGELKNQKYAGIILRSNFSKGVTPLYKDFKKSLDYFSDDKNGIIEYDGQILSFKIQNPSEQSIGTFHREILDNRRKWYNQQTPKLQLKSINTKNYEYVKVDPDAKTILIEFLRNNRDLMILGSVCNSMLEGKEGKYESIVVAFKHKDLARRISQITNLLIKFIDSYAKKIMDTKLDFHLATTPDILGFLDSVNKGEKFWNIEISHHNEEQKEYLLDLLEQTEELVKYRKKLSILSGLPKIKIYSKEFNYAVDIFKDLEMLDYESCAAFYDENAGDVVVSYLFDLKDNIKQKYHNSSNVNYFSKIFKNEINIDKNSVLISEKYNKKILDNIINIVS